MNNRNLGKSGEALAAQLLRDKGYDVLCLNYSVRQGEIDIIAKDGSYLVFTEVKYRHSALSGHPLEAVTPQKQRTICKVARFYMNEHGLDPFNTLIRFDVISILGENEIEHLTDAFQYRR